MGSKPSQPKQTAQQKALEHLNYLMARKALRDSKKKVKEPSFDFPEMQESAPPPSQTASDVSDAEQDSRRRNARRRGYSSTLLAGDTGGYRAGLGGSTGSLLG